MSVNKEFKRSMKKLAKMWAGGGFEATELSQIFFFFLQQTCPSGENTRVAVCIGDALFCSSVPVSSDTVSLSQVHATVHTVKLNNVYM